MGVPFAEATPTDGYMEADGLRLHYLDWGARQGPTVLLLHGFAQSGHSFDFVSLSLSDRFRVVAPDLRGHGESDWSPDGDYRRETMLADVIRLVETLDLAPVALVGLSLGGTLGYMLAASRPDLARSLVIVDIAPRVEPKGARRVREFVEGKDYFDSLQEMVEAVKAFRPGRSEEQLRGSVLRNAKHHPDGRWSWKYDPVMRRPVSARQHDPEQERMLWAALENVRCPTLVVRGADSDVVSQESVDEMVARLPQITGAKSTTVEGAGHLVPGDNPAGFIRAVEPFLSETAADRAGD